MAKNSETDEKISKVNQALQEFSCYTSKKLPDAAKASIALGLSNLDQALQPALKDLAEFGTEAQKNGGAAANLQHKAAGRYFIFQGATQHLEAANLGGTSHPMVAASLNTVGDSLWSLWQLRKKKSE